MEFLAKEISRDTYVNIMAQYHPDAKVNSENYPEINRRPTREEMSIACQYAKAAGLHRFDER